MIIYHRANTWEKLKLFGPRFIVGESIDEKERRKLIQRIEDHGGKRIEKKKYSSDVFEGNI